MNDQTAPLKDLLIASLDADASARNEAETELNRRIQTGKHEVLFECLNLAADPTVHMSCRRAAVVYLKNLTKQYDKLDLSQDYLQVLRQGLFKGITESTDGTTTQIFCAVVGIMIQYDYPSKWSDLDNTIEDLLNSEQMATVFCGVLVLLELVKKHPESNIIIERFMPRLLVMAESLTKNSSMVMSNEMLWKIMKIFRTVISHTQARLPVYFTDRNNLASWMNIFLRQVSLGTVKCRKWSMRIINILFIENVHNDDYREQEDTGLLTHVAVNGNGNSKAFKDMFINDFAPEICGEYLVLTKSVSITQWSSQDKCCLMRFFLACLDYGKLAQLVVNELQVILEMNFASMVMTPDEVDLFNDNEATEFINEQYPDDDDIWSVQAIAGNFIAKLVDLCPEVLQTIVALICQMTDDGSNENSSDEVKNSNSNNDNTGNNNNGSTLNKDCTLRILIRVPKLQDALNMNQFIPRVLSMINDQTSAVLQARACEFVSSVYPGIFQKSLAKQLYTAVMHCMETSNMLIVQIRSILAIRALLAYNSIREEHKDKIKITVDKLLSVSTEVSSDVFFEGVLEELFELYKEELLPHSIELFMRLRDQFMKLENSSSITSNDCQVAQGILNTVTSVIYSLSDNITVLEQSVNIILPVLELSLKNIDMDCVPEAFEVIHASMISSNTVLGPVWRIFESICLLYQEKVAEDYLEELLPCLAHFANYGSQVFSDNPKYCRMLFDILYTELITNDCRLAINQINACALEIVALFRFSNTSLGGLIAPMLEACVEGNIRLLTEPHVAYYYTDLLLSLIYYDPETVLLLLEPGLPRYMHQWVSSASTRPCSLKIRQLALLKILTSERATQIVWPYVPQLVKHSLIPTAAKDHSLGQEQALEAQEGMGSMFVFQQQDPDGMFFLDDSDLTDMQQTLDMIDENLAYAKTMEWLAINFPEIYKQIESMLSVEQQALHQKLCTNL